MPRALVVVVVGVVAVDVVWETWCTGLGENLQEEFLNWRPRWVPIVVPGVSYVAGGHSAGCSGSAVYVGWLAAIMQGNREV